MRTLIGTRPLGHSEPYTALPQGDEARLRQRSVTRQRSLQDAAAQPTVAHDVAAVDSPACVVPALPGEAVPR